MHSQFLMLLSLVPNHGVSNMIFGGNNEELHKFQKYMERYIFIPLENYHLKRDCRMGIKKNILYSILKPQINAHFFLKGFRKNYPFTKPYLINKTIRFYISTCYFSGGYPLDIILVHGVSYTSVFLYLWFRPST